MVGEVKLVVRHTPAVAPMTRGFGSPIARPSGTFSWNVWGSATNNRVKLSQVTTTVAASAIRWSLDRGGPSLVRGPCRICRPLTKDPDRFILNTLGVVEVDVPTEVPSQFGQHLAVHDRVGSALIRDATLDGDLLGKVPWPGSQ